MEARIHRARPGEEITRVHERRSWPISGIYFPRPAANELRSPITRVRPANITRYCRLGPRNDYLFLRLLYPPPIPSHRILSARRWRRVPVVRPDSKRLFHGNRWVGVRDRKLFIFFFFFRFDQRPNCVVRSPEQINGTMFIFLCSVR